VPKQVAGCGSVPAFDYCKTREIEMEKHFQSVLIVEDDHDLRESLRELISSEGYAALEAENGQVALDLLLGGKVAEPCLILLDLMMPELNGWEFLNILRQNDAIAAIPTIIVTAAAGVKMPKGSNKVIKKPINIIELIQAIETYCTPTCQQTFFKKTAG
jgi:CheY-like chemotaxis protein